MIKITCSNEIEMTEMKKLFFDPDSACPFIRVCPTDPLCLDCEPCIESRVEIIMKKEQE